MALHFSFFQKYPELKYGFSTKQDGSMKWFADKNLYEKNLQNRKHYFSKINIPLEKVVVADLVHSPHAVEVGVVHGGEVISQTDALVTQTLDTFLTVTGADCFPVYFYEPHSKTVGLAHVGWRGLVDGVLKNTAELMRRVSKTTPEHFLVGIGPGIRKCHFDINPENVHYYEKYSEAIIKKDDKVFINLPAVIKARLEEMGIRHENVEDSEECTYCLGDKYFSFRRDKPERVDAMVAYIGIKL